MSRTLIISADGHVAPPIDAYRPYLDERYRAEFDDMLKAQAMVTTSFADNVDPVIFKQYREDMYDSGAIEGKHDVQRRLKDLAKEGIVAEVLFPDGAPFGAGGIGANRKRFQGEFELAGARAYNRWLADFVSDSPYRLAGQAIVSLWDIDEAIKDVHWAAEHGLKGLVMPGVEGSPRPLWDPVYEPFWAACAEAAMPLNYHGGIGCQPDYGPPIEGVEFCVRLRVQAFEHPWFAHRPLWWLIWCGALERHPDLKLVFTEQHSDWIPSVLAKLDHSYDHSLFDDAIKKIVRKRPSEYWAGQCYTGASLLSRVDLLNRHEIGTKNMMFGADYPHPEGTAVHTLEYLQATVGDTDMTESEALDFLGRNAAELFRFDTAALQAEVEKCGPELADVLTPVVQERRYLFDRKDVVRP